MISFPMCEYFIPISCCDTEVAGEKCVMMFGMTTLGPMQICAGTRTPVMDSMMHQNIPEISENKSSRQTAC